MTEARPRVLVLNAGSSRLKFALYDVDAGSPGEHARWRGKIDGIGASSPIWPDNSTDQAKPLTLDVERLMSNGWPSCAPPS